MALAHRAPASIFKDVGHSCTETKLENILILGALFVLVLLAQAIGESILQFIAYWTARLAIPTLTGGRMIVSELREPPKGLDAAGIQTMPDGRRVISIEWASIVGFVIWLIGLAVLIVAALWWPSFARG